MKTFIALCIFGAVAMAIPQDRPQVLPPAFNRPPRPGMEQHPGLDMPNPFHRPGHETGRPHINPNIRVFMKDVRDFLELYPRRAIRDLLKEHIKDPELRATFKFLRSPEFKEIMHTIQETPELQAIHEYFTSAEWPWLQDTIAQEFAKFECEHSNAVAGRSSGGLNAFLDAIIAVLPKDQLRALFEDKMQNSPVFRSVIEIMSSDALKAMIQAAEQSPVVQAQFARLLEHGVDAQKIISLKMALVGY